MTDQKTEGIREKLNAYAKVPTFVDRYFNRVKANEKQGPAPVVIDNPVQSPQTPKEAVSWPLQVAAAWSWRALVVAAAGVTLGYGIYQLQVVVVPIMVSLLIAVILMPLADFLDKKLHLPRSLAAAIALIVGISIVVGALSLAGTQIASGASELVGKTSEGIKQAINWLTDGPLALDKTQVNDYLRQLGAEMTSYLQNHKAQIASGAVFVTSSVGSLFASGITALFCIFFFVKDGRNMWLWCVRLLPAAARIPAHEAGIRGWVTLGSYARTQMLVAAIDAVGIGASAYFLGVPMFFPIAVLVFLGGFIPIVGAMITGAVAVLVALVDQGPMVALAMAVCILVIQQLEGNVLQPILMSNAVSLHPVAVVLAVAVGSYFAGIIGALFAVPIAAFVNTSALYLQGTDKFPELAVDENRPGGPPGMLVKELVQYAVPNDNSKELQDSGDDIKPGAGVCSTSENNVETVASENKK